MRISRAKAGLAAIVLAGGMTLVGCSDDADTPTDDPTMIDPDEQAPEDDMGEDDMGEDDMGEDDMDE